MKLIFRTFLIITLTYLLSLYFPWWTIVGVAFVIGFIIHGNGFNVFISGFLGGGLVWLVYAWYVDTKTNSILSVKIVELFPFDDKIYLVISAGVIGALCGGLGAATGNSFKQLFIKKKSKSFYS